jgi:hypothetical protein
MTSLIELRMRTGAALAALLAGAALASCGGDGTVGSGGTGYAPGQVLGTVNGFGSVIVDGVAYDDRGVAVVSEVAPGVDAPADPKLGQRVSVNYETAGVADTIRVGPAIDGPVASAFAAGSFTILGQTVTVNSDGAAGPVTQFGGGYTQASDLRVGDAIEIHGVPFGQAGAYVIQATRIDKLPALPAYLRVSGLVGNLAASPGSFALAGLTVGLSGANVLPSAGALSNGQSVTVLALPSQLSGAGATPLSLQAAQVRIEQLHASDLQAYVSGYLSHLDTTASTFTIGSQSVSYAGATVTPSTASLANGSYVQVRGTVAGDGSLGASAVTIREAGSDDESELRGNIGGYVAATSSFSVRGVSVDASTASLQSCPASGLADGLFVEVHGALSSTGVVAATVQCESESDDSTVDRNGVASNVDLAGMTFTLVPEHGASISVAWSNLTYFGGVTPAALSGKSLEVEGTLNGSVLVASKIKLDD